jgi:hypothetical protein
LTLFDLSRYYRSEAPESLSGKDRCIANFLGHPFLACHRASVGRIGPTRPDVTIFRNLDGEEGI